MAVRSLVAYMRAHGNTPGPTQRPLTTGALAAALAELPAAALLWRSGALTSLAAAIGAAELPTLLLHAAVVVLGGALYGRVFGRAANDRRGGWLFGISYGYLLWMLGPAGVLQAVLGKPVAVGGAAMGLLFAHLVHGTVSGAIFPHLHRRLMRTSPKEEER
jgi:hypothetical protein